MDNGNFTRLETQLALLAELGMHGDRARVLLAPQEQPLFRMIYRHDYPDYPLYTIWTYFKN
jgi:hypothetical protein